MEREHDIVLFLVLSSLLTYVVAKDYEESSDSCSYILRHFKDIQRQRLSLHKALPMIVCKRVGLVVVFPHIWLEYAAKLIPY